MEQWFAFRAFNTQALYGYGTAEEAERFTARLNANREINLYAEYALTETEATELRLEDSTEAFNLSDTLRDLETED